MAVVTLTGTVQQSDGSAWANAHVEIRLMSDTDLEFPPQPVVAIANGEGAFSVDVYTSFQEPVDCLAHLPDGDGFRFSLDGAQTANLDLGVLRSSGRIGVANVLKQASPDPSPPVAEKILGVRASGTYTFTDNPSDGDTAAGFQDDASVVFKESPSGPNEISIGSSISETIDNLISYLNDYFGSSAYRKVSSNVMGYTSQQEGVYGNGEILIYTDENTTAPIIASGDGSSAGGVNGLTQTKADKSELAAKANAADFSTLLASTYTPVGSSLSNASSVDTASGHYFRFQNQVFVFFRVRILAIAAGNVTVRLSLPIPSNLIGAANLAGCACSDTGIGGWIIADDVNDKANLSFISTGNSFFTLVGSFAYDVH